jgi:site-specific DNA recombinase
VLTGLIQDAAGNRLTPSFTIKRGKRYRYYVSQAVVQNPGREQAGIARLPAHGIESLVVARIVAFLKSDTDVFDQLGKEGRWDLAQLRKQIEEAKKLAGKLSALPSDDLRDLLSSFVQRVVVQANQIELMIARNALYRLLLADGKTTARDRSGRVAQFEDGDLICLRIEANLKKQGGVIHVIVPPNHGTTPTSAIKPSLLKALARAHGWYEMVLEGKAVDQRALARHARLTERYVGKVLPCAFLAPDIVESILQGHQSSDLTFARLASGIPLSWVEQRRQLRFPLTAPR